MSDKKVYYSSYLQLEKILNAQELESQKVGKPAHDENLFIVIHQTYELWFKQIITELVSIVKIFEQPVIADSQLITVNSRLERIIEIQKILVQQIQVMETMTPLDFLDFRDLLNPASGFQSFQFRLVEIGLGLKNNQRINYDHNAYLNRLSKEHRQLVEEWESKPSLFDLVEKWLSRMPFLKLEKFGFWDLYQSAVNKMLNEDEQRIRQNPFFGPEQLKMQLDFHQLTVENFASVLNEQMYLEWQKKGKRRLKHQALQSAILINLYRDEAILSRPFKLLSNLVEIDNQLTLWRYRHALMAHRILGYKIGTGGSSGHQYLKNSADKHRIYIDLYNISTYLVPRSQLPALPAKLKQNMGLYFELEGSAL